MSQINANQAAGASIFSVLSDTSDSAVSGFDFRTALSNLFNASSSILKDYADPNTTTISINGFAPFDKNSPSAQLSVSIALTRLETQLNTLMSGMEFALKTFPQKIDSLFA